MAHVAAFILHSTCTTSDGSMFTWGDGHGGQLGFGDDRSNKLVTTPVRGEVENKAAVQVAAGYGHLACVVADGSVCTWGDNNQGQLGVTGGGQLGLLVLLQALDMNAM